MGLVGNPTCQHDKDPPPLHGCLWHGHEHQAGNPDGHGEVQQRRHVLGGGEHDVLQAGPVPGHGGVQQVWAVQHPASPGLLTAGGTLWPSCSTGTATATPTSGPTCGLTSSTEGARGKLRREGSLRLTRLPSSRSSLPTTTSSRRTLGR